MRILELRLLACGPFTDFSLDLSDGPRGLHLIFGPNEAGKSSALRAITYLCFGFPTQVDDDFVHPYAALRVGARLRDEQNDELDFVRRKAAKGSLRDREDSAIIEEDALRRFLGGIDPLRFKTFFGIDHSMLVKGGKEIIEGGGDTGQILFSAGGANDLREILSSLQKDAEKLFAPTARNRELNQLLTQLAETKRAVRDHQLPAREWEEHQHAFARASKRKQEAEAVLHEAYAERARLERIAKGLPLIAALADLRQKATPLSASVLLAADFTKRRQAAQQLLRDAERDQNRARAKIDELQRHLGELCIPTSLIERQSAIEPLATELGVFRRAQSDRPKQEAKARQLEADGAELLRQLGNGLDLAAAEKLQLSESKRVRIRDLGGQYGALVKDVENWTVKLDELEPAMQEIAAQLLRLPAVRDIGALASAVQDTLRLGNIEEELSAAGNEWEASSKQLAIGLGRLPLWHGTIDQLEAIAAPLPETIERLEKEFADIDKEQKAVNRRLEERRGEAAELERKLDALRLECDVPSEADLQVARHERERAWQSIRQSWFAGERGSEELATAFGRSVEASDQIADRLRREAGRVATHAELAAQEAECARRIAALLDQLQSVSARREKESADWNRLWQSICDAPLPPREMLRWSRQHAELVQQAESLRRQRDRAQQLQERLEQRRGRLVELLSTFGSAPLPPNPTLEELVAAATRWIEETADIARQHRELAAESERLEKEQKRAEQKLSAARAKLDTWQKEWTAAISELPLDAAGGPNEANAILDLLAQLREKQRGAREARDRIGEMNQAIEQFAADVREVASQVAPDLTDLPADRAAEEFGQRLHAALAADRNRELLEGQLAIERQCLATATEMIEKVQIQLASLCQEARCEFVADLPAAEDRSLERRDLEKAIRGQEERLRDFSAGQPLAVFIAEAQAADADALEPRIRQLEQQIDQLDRELKDELGPKIGEERHALDMMDSSAKAADAAEQVHDLMIQIGGAAREYARLQIALATLRKGIERYRKQHQGPIIGRAGEFFCRLTLGAFAGLKEEFDGEGRPELTAIRAADERLVRMPEMSDGTADQLFLAVRLAWLSEYLETHPPIPFIVDDILIRFDDERSAATLQLLAELSARTQVILFTHHRHIVELARSSLDADSLFVHELPSASGVQSTLAD